MKTMEELVSNFVKACELLNKNGPYAGPGAVNLCTNTGRELLRAVLDQYGYKDVELPR